MATLRSDGTITTSDGKVLYGDDLPTVQDVLELVRSFAHVAQSGFIASGGGGSTRRGTRGSGATGSQGPQGFAGPAGGSQGPQGDMGPQGDQGDPGAGGPQGAQGVQGSTGSAGGTGPQGAQGPQGLVGNVGPQGPSGAVGTQGNQGPQGTAGSTGTQGPQGSVGPQGTSGTAGVQGPQGPQGLVGPQGLQGPSGGTFVNSARFADQLQCAVAGCTASFSTGALGFTPTYARLTMYGRGNGGDPASTISSVGVFVGTNPGDQYQTGRLDTYAWAGTAGYAGADFTGTGEIGQVTDDSSPGTAVPITCTAFGAGGITIEATAPGGQVIQPLNSFLLEVFG